MKSFKQIGPIRLPHEWKKGTVKECIHRMFEFEKKRYLVAEVGNVKNGELVRIQSACALADLFNSKWCDCDWQLKAAKKLLFEKGNGLLIHAFDQHGKGVGLRDHYRIYAEGQKRNQELLTETFDFLGLKYDNRNYDDILEILKFYNLSKIQLMTNDPKRMQFFTDNGIEVTRVPLVPPIDKYNREELILNHQEKASKGICTLDLEFFQLHTKLAL